MDTQLRHIRHVVSLLIFLSGILGLPRHSPAHVVEFMCAAGDVACLIEAITQANANGEANTITLDAGIYTLTAVNDDTDGPNGLPSVTGVLTIQGAGADATIQERDANAPAFRLVHVATTGALTLEGLTLRRGIGRGPVVEFGSTAGGGILNHGGRLTLEHITLEGNTAGGGGGLMNLNGAVAIAESHITGNSAGLLGGGLLNSALEGSPVGQVLITTTTFANNTADDGGGGLSNRPGGVVTIAKSTFVRNRVFFFGGGGLSNGGTLLVQNTTLAGNRAASVGGGLGNSGTAILTNVTIADNEAGQFGGGGLANSGQLVMLNTILARNTIVQGIGPDCRGTVSGIGQMTSLGTNLVGDPTGCPITLLPTDRTGDPGLGDFTDDGTPGNGHFPLLPGSPAIAAGNDAFCPPTDQLGQRRVGPCDIGAIEFRGKRHKHH
jgi:hypothetical protein